MDSNYNGLTISGCGNAILNGGVVLDSNDFTNYPSSDPLNINDNSIQSNIKVYDLNSIGITLSELGGFEPHGYGIDDGSFKPLLFCDSR